MNTTNQSKHGLVYTIGFSGWNNTVQRLLEHIEFSDQLMGGKPILIKPNLVEALAPPITTPVELVEAIVTWFQQMFPENEILIGEGTGSIEYDTFHCFKSLGYTDMAARCGIELIDLNHEELTVKHNPNCTRWPEIHLPALLDSVFLFSVPVLKAHSLAGVTLTMKNMMGCAPPAHYQRGGSWGKSAFHERIQEAVFDLNRYRTPDFTLLDATVGMSQAHLWGPHCNPPVNRLAASFDPVAIDSYGCSLLDRGWQRIGHILMAHQLLGMAEPLQVVEIEV